MAVASNEFQKLATDAAIARCDLNILYGVIAILEGGTVSSNVNRDAERIINICRTASQKALRRYDTAIQQLGEWEP